MAKKKGKKAKKQKKPTRIIMRGPIAGGEDLPPTGRPVLTVY